MLEYFFDIRKPKSKKLFSEFKITEEAEFCEKHQNKYPVINVSLKGVKETDWKEYLEKFKDLISELYKEHRYLLKSDKLEKDEKQIIENIISRTANNAEFKSSLKKLSNYLQKHFFGVE